MATLDSGEIALHVGSMIDVNHPFYRPLWRRIAIVAVTLAWLAFELLVSQDGFWTVIAGGMAGAALWFFLISWKDPPESSAP